MSNDHGAKGLANNRFLMMKHLQPKRRSNKWKMNEKI